MTLLTVGISAAGALGEQALLSAFFPINVSRVSPISMNQSSVQAALFPVTGPLSRCFLYAFGSRDHAGKLPRFGFYVTVFEKILAFVSAGLTGNCEGKGFLCVL